MTRVVIAGRRWSLRSPDDPAEKSLLAVLAAFVYRTTGQPRCTLALVDGGRVQRMQVEPGAEDTLQSLVEKMAFVADADVVDAVLSRGGTPDSSMAPLILHWDGTLELEGSFEPSSGSTRPWAVGHFERLMQGMVEHPETAIGDVGLMDDEEKTWQMATLNQTAWDWPEQTLCQRIEEIVRQTPDALVVRYGGVTLSYRELQVRSDEMARILNHRGVQAGGLVGVCVPRSIDMVVALLAVWKAGAAYLPLDPGLPPDRLAYMVEDARLQFIVEDPETEAVVGRAAPGATRISGRESSPSGSAAMPVPSMDGTAYVLYTSGSTGRPKGTPITHRALMNALRSAEKDLGYTARDVFLAITTLSFDIAELEIHLPLLAGGLLVVGTSDLALGQTLGAAIAAERPTWTMATPSTYKLLLQTGWTGAPGSSLLSIGEQLERELVDALQARVRAVYNLYGPTETTIYSTWCRVEPAPAPVLIGRPIANTGIYILDDKNRLVPAGMRGELCIGGLGLSEGYLGRDDLNRQKFIHPFPEERETRVYRTGDVARYLPDGTLECLGRADDQLKINGRRIEPGEIEAVLSAHPAVAQAAVVPHHVASDDVRLIGYWLAEAPVPVPVPVPVLELRAHCARHLPSYMVPVRLVRLDRFPMTPNGKLDRRALSALPLDEAQDDEVAPSADSVPPRTALERDLAAMWQDLLHTRPGGIHDDFFDRGGDSITGIRLMSTCMSKYGVKLATVRFLACRTIAEQAALVGDAMEHSPATDVAPNVTSASESMTLPCLFSQRQYLRTIDNANPLSLPYLFRLQGPLEVAALERSLQRIVKRHQGLRTLRLETAGPVGRYCWPNILDTLQAQVAQFSPWRMPARQILGAEGSIELRVDDLRTSRSCSDAFLLEVAEKLVETPLDSRRGPLGDVSLLRFADDLHVLCLKWHHTIMDGWSMNVFFQELAEFYEDALEGRERPVDPAPQVSDLVRWEQKEFKRLGPDARYWKRRLGPTDDKFFFVRKNRPFRMSRSAPIEGIKNLMPRIQHFARQQSATPGMFFMAAIAAIIERFTGRRTSSIAIFMPNRALPMTQNLVTNAVFNFPVSVTVSPDMTFGELVRQVRHDTEEGYDHQLAVPLNMRRYDAILDIGVPMREVRLKGLEVSPVVLPTCDERFPFPAIPYLGRSWTDAPLALMPTLECYGSEWSGFVQFDARVFGASFRFHELLERLLSRPDERLSLSLGGVDIPPAAG